MVNCSLVAGFLAYGSVLTRVSVSVGLAYDSVPTQVSVSIGLVYDSVLTRVSVSIAVDTDFMVRSAFHVCWDIPNVLSSAF